MSRGAAGNDARVPVLPGPGNFSQISMVMEGRAQRYWHHLCLLRVRDALWVTVDPEGDLAVDDISKEQVVPLVPGAPIPAGERPLLMIEKLPESELNGYIARAHQLAALWGATPAAGVTTASATWFFSDPAHLRFGEEVPVDLMANPISCDLRDAMGLVKAAEETGDDPAWAHIERVSRKDVTDWIAEKREGAGRDPRLLRATSPERAAAVASAAASAARPATGSGAVSFGPAHQRPPTVVAMRRTFRDAVVAFGAAPTTVDPSIFQGLPALPEVCVAIVRSNLEPTAYGDAWVRTSGVGPRAAVAIEVVMILQGFWMMACIDGLNLYQLTSAEHQARRVLQIQRAVRANARSPDFRGLDAYMRHMPDASGLAYTPLFDQYITTEQRTDAQIMKQQRMQKEEEDLADKDKNKKQPKGKGKGDAE